MTDSAPLNPPSLLQLQTQDIQTQEIGATRVKTDPSFWNANSSFGGWVAAVIIQLVTQHSEFRGEILSQQMQFIRAISGDEIDISVQLLAQRSSIDFWRVDVKNPNQQLLATAELTSGLRKATSLSFETQAPDQGDGPGVTMEISPMHPKWMSHFEQVLLKGEPFTVAERPYSLVRTKPLGGVGFDLGVLAMICDSPMPRTFFVTTELVFCATISLAIHNYATAEQLQAVGNDSVLVEADSAVVRNNMLNQEVRVFRDDGLLLACSYQTAIFRSGYQGT